MIEKPGLHCPVCTGPGGTTFTAPPKRVGPAMADATPPMAGQPVHPVTSAPSLRHALRAATSDAHARVDAAFSQLDLACPGDYRRFLAAQAGAVLPLEAALDRAGAATVLPDWPARRRSAALLEDLRRLGQRPDRPLPVGDGGGLGWVLGALYVLEGSRLGGQVLRRRVRAGPDAECQAATAYLSHGIGRHPWHGFLHRLETSAYGTGDPATVIAGAIDAFILFEHAAQIHSQPQVSIHAVAS